MEWEYTNQTNMTAYSSDRGWISLCDTDPTFFIP